MWPPKPISGRMIVFDVNGDKLPNQLNRDRFVFASYNYQNCFDEPYEYSFQPASGSSKETLLRECKDAETVKESMSCLSLIQNNGWEIPDDYPHRI